MEAWMMQNGSVLRAWVAAHWGGASLLALSWMASWHFKLEARRQADGQRRERKLREELQAYARFDASTTKDLGAGMEAAEASRVLARRVCRIIAEKSAFTKVSLLLRDAEGRLVCFGSAGADDLTVAAMQAWGERIVQDERGGGRTPAIAAGGKSFAIPLGEWARYDRVLSPRHAAGRRERRRWRRAIVTPIWAPGNTAIGRMLGAIIVCADASAGGAKGIERTIGAIEALASRLGTSIENRALSERLLRAEKLASLGQLAGGVAHALNNPLTAVLGFGELIRETSEEPRVRQDAATIVNEALKMKETVQRLIEFWRPVAVADEMVDLCGMVRELTLACEGKLEDRGVRLELTMPNDLPEVRGSRERLRKVLEHLLNNAAQAIAVKQTSARRETDETAARPSIRINLSHDEHALHLIVSDTGPGFKEPGRVFDPFYTTKGPEHGAGLGLSICYGIVREHGGEISALNLLPHGAAVVVELPINRLIREPPACVSDMVEQARRN